METDIVDEIERYLSKYRIDSASSLKLKYLDDLTVSSEETHSSFNKTWCKLGLPEKLNRLMRYLTKAQLKLNLDAAHTEALRKFFYENVNTSLSSDDFVSYDPVEAEIITILGLKCEGGNFYLHKQETQPKPEGVRVKQRVFANIGHLISSAAAKPEISHAPISDSKPKRAVVVKKKIKDTDDHKVSIY